MTKGTYIWSKTDASNDIADSSINWAEGQAPSTVNNSARGMMGRIAEYRDDTAGSLLTAGTSSAYTLTTNQVFDSLAHMNGARLTVRFHTSSAANPPTLNVDGLGAKNINLSATFPASTGFFSAGTIWDLTYDNSIPAWIVANTPVVLPNIAIAGTIQLANGAVGAPSLQWSSETNSGFYRIAANDYGWAVNGVKLWEWSAAAATLTGTLNVTTAYQLNGSPLVARGDCQLQFTDSTHITLFPFKGNQVTLPDGSTLTIPSAGTAALISSTFLNGAGGSALSASTGYFVYLFNNGGTPALDFSATGHSTDTTSGIEIKTGVSTRVLVGFVFVDGSTHFNDSATKRNVASWFNPRLKQGISTYSIDRTTTSSTFVELNAETEIEVSVLGTPAMQVSTYGISSEASTNNYQTGIGVNSTTTATLSSGASVGSGGGNGNNMTVSGVISLAEGHSTLSLLGNIVGGTTLTHKAGGGLTALVVN